MWELDCKESWVLKNWCFWTVVLEKTLESPLDCKEIQPVHFEGDQPWVFFGRNDAKAETPILWPPHVKNWLTGKDSDIRRDWGQEEKGTTEDEMAGWHHWLDAHEFIVNSGSWWWTGRPGVLRFMGSQRVGHDWATELTELNWQLKWMNDPIKESVILQSFTLLFLTHKACWMYTFPGLCTNRPDFAYKGHLAISGDVFICHTGGWGWVLLAVSVFND